MMKITDVHFKLKLLFLPYKWELVMLFFMFKNYILIVDYRKQNS